MNKKTTAQWLILLPTTFTLAISSARPTQSLAATCTPEQIAPLEYDWQNSAQEISNGTSGSVQVLGGVLAQDTPLTWTISGKGFSFANGKTSAVGGREQIVEVAAGACGGGTITVSDSCQQSSTGSVRSSSGFWEKLPEPICGMPVELLTNQRKNHYEVSMGTVKTVQDFASWYSVSGSVYWHENPYMLTEPMCSFWGTSPSYSPCLTPINTVKCPSKEIYLLEGVGGFEYGGANAVGTYWNGTQYASGLAGEAVSYEWVSNDCVDEQEEANDDTGKTCPLVAVGK